MCQINVRCWECGMKETDRVSMPTELCLHYQIYINMVYMALQDVRPLTTIRVSFLTILVSNTTQHTSVYSSLYTSCSSYFSPTDPFLSTLTLSASYHAFSKRESLSLTNSDWVKYSSAVVLYNTYIPYHHTYYIVNTCIHNT